ncbi:hypothetical protein [Acinetobacter sp. XS-4]|uniref:hypothetical protein n=1 Tax=Acinetobacter sp. XS-4 TaxID=2923375 RepID=UPI00208ED62F|nr:hypothetical protein [Acinetobacter sp. XS-4]USP39252.1 hypothetical protein MMY79_12515 [Acinetobacter sp. XS-4]
MFNSPVFNSIIGLVLTYALITVFVSSLIEAISIIFHKRAKDLKDGLTRMLDNLQIDGLINELYQHPLINPINYNKPNKIPSYIDPKCFAKALHEILSNKKVRELKLNKLLEDLPEDSPVKAFLDSLVSDIDEKTDSVQKNLMIWFDVSMDRLSGEYKRSIQFWSFLLAFVIALALNADTLRLSQIYWGLSSSQLDLLLNTSAHIQSSLPADVAKNVQDNFKNLNKLPIGWDRDCTPCSSWGVVKDFFVLNTDNIKHPSLQNVMISIGKLFIFIIGCFITACSVLFGAPFWFDLLKSFVNIRGTGKKPNQ